MSAELTTRSVEKTEYQAIDGSWHLDKRDAIGRSSEFRRQFPDGRDGPTHATFEDEFGPRTVLSCVGCMNLFCRTQQVTRREYSPRGEMFGSGGELIGETIDHVYTYHCAALGSGDKKMPEVNLARHRYKADFLIPKNTCPLRNQKAPGHD